VVIPAYNEALRLPGYLKDVQAYFEGRDEPYEVVVVEAEALFPRLGTDGFGFDVELLLLAQRRGYRIVEVPVNWADQPGSKVGVLRDGPHMLREVLAARRRLARLPDGGRA
jgi:hypothetical protein